MMGSLLGWYRLGMEAASLSKAVFDPEAQQGFPLKGELPVCAENSSSGVVVMKSAQDAK